MNPSTSGTHDSTFVVRRMTRPQVDLAIEWAAAEGWNPGLHDAACFHSADPNGFFMGELDGEPVGCISAVAYDGEFGFIGLYIVKPEFRGLGFGIRIWRTALAYLGSRLIGLDGVIAQQSNYERSGFRLAYRNIRFEGSGKAGIAKGAVDLSAVPFERLVAYDSELFPSRRARFLECWTHQPVGAAFGVLRGDRLAGYGIIRACRRGFKIGPLFADEEQIAEDLFQGPGGARSGTSGLPRRTPGQLRGRRPGKAPRHEPSLRDGPDVHRAGP